MIYGFWLLLWYLLTLDHYVACPMIYGFWLSHWYLLTLDHYVACPMIYGFWLFLWYIHTFLTRIYHAHSLIIFGSTYEYVILKDDTSGMFTLDSSVHTGTQSATRRQTIRLLAQKVTVLYGFKTMNCAMYV
jgi:hypothetical protein